MNQIELKIESSVYGGSGIARVDGKVYFVENTVEGDYILAKIEEVKKKYTKASFIKFIKPSELRNPSPCSYSDRCGGCDWLEISIENQLKWKKQFVIDSLKRIGHLDLHHPIEVVASPKNFNYRNKITLQGEVNDIGEFEVSFLKKKSHEPISIKSCQIANVPINLFLEELVKKKSSLRNLRFRIEIQNIPYLQSDNKKNLLITIYSDKKDSKNLFKEKTNLYQILAKEISQFEQVVSSCFVEDIDSSKLYLFDFKDLKYFTSQGTFQQVNTEVNYLLRKYIIEKIGSLNVQSILDLFCGSGNLSLFLSDGIKDITGVEASSGSILAAREAVKKNELKFTKYIQDRADLFFKKSVTSLKKWDLILVDPPRSGLIEVTAYILRLAPKFIFYISCDPTTLSRDMSVLKTKYKINEIKLFDFFPQTYHIETVLFLSHL